MNNNRRNRIATLSDSLGEALAEVENIRDEEQEYFDAMPENMTEGNRGQNSKEAISYLECVVESLENAIEDLEAAEG